MHLPNPWLLLLCGALGSVASAQRADPIPLAEPALRLYGTQLVLPLVTPAPEWAEKHGLPPDTLPENGLRIHLGDVRVEPDGERLDAILSRLKETGGEDGARLAEGIAKLSRTEAPEERLAILMEVLEVQPDGKAVTEWVHRLRVDPVEGVFTLKDLNPQLVDDFGDDFGDLWGVHLRPGEPPYFEQLRDPENLKLQPWMIQDKEMMLIQPCLGLVVRPPPPYQDQLQNPRVTDIDGFRATVAWEAHPLNAVIPGTSTRVDGPDRFHLKRFAGLDRELFNTPFVKRSPITFEVQDDRLIPTEPVNYCLTAERNGLQLSAARLPWTPPDVTPPAPVLRAALLSPRAALLEWDELPTWALSHFSLELDDRVEVSQLSASLRTYLADPKSRRGDHLYKLVAHWKWGNKTSSGTAPIHGLPRLQGVADLHAHQFSNHAFGGNVFHGSPGGPESGLTDCTLHGEDPFDPSRAMDVINAAASGLAMDRLSHLRAGYPNFNEWPHYNDMTHQQMHKRWLQRAWKGGLRLMVNLAVNNQALCRAATLKGQAPAPGRNCSDWDNVIAQIDAAHALEAEIDAESGGAGRGWYRIVETPEQARHAILDGKLAVVLGVEVDHLFSCGPDGQTCDVTQLRTQIAELQARGVRHVFPIHLLDNEFGGAAVYSDFFNAANWIVNGRFYSVRDCNGLPNATTPSIQYQLTAASDLGFLTSLLGVPLPNYPNVPHCNAIPLTTAGGRLLTELMRAGMIIDIDHMSDFATQGAMSFFEQVRYPIVAGHTWFNAQATSAERAHEANLDDATLARLDALGGMVGVVLGQGAVSDQATFTDGSGGQTEIPNDCDGSGSGWVQAYQHAVARRGGRPVAIGSDFNGMLRHPAPRFNRFGSNEACAGSGARTTGMVSYPFTDRFGTFDRQVAGNRVFDINFDGFVTVGQLPDFIQSLRALGVQEAELNPLYESADGYLEMWEGVERARHRVP